MKTVICDICGRPMDHTNRYEMKEGLTLKIKAVQTEVDCHIVGRIYRESKRIDICRTCMNKIYEECRKDDN